MTSIITNTMEPLRDALPNIEKKIAEAPDKSYEIGVFVGSLLPFIVLVALAYLLYWYMKRNKDVKDLLDD